MSDSERKPLTLYVPTNITTHFEFVSGVGVPEMVVTGLATAVAIVVAVLMNAITHDLYKSVLIVLISATATFMAVRKNDMNQSIIDMVRLSIRFSSSQKKYKYEYKPKNWGD